MKTMRAVVVTAPGKVALVSGVPVPEPGPYEVLAKVHTCGFCNGTDFQIINGTIGKVDGFLGYPTVLGHEGAGEVVKLGEKVRHYKIGDRVIHPNLRPDVGGGYTKAYGGMAEYGLINDNEAMLEDGYTPRDFPFTKQGRFPKEMAYADASVLLTLSECNSAVRNFGVRQNDRVLIYGAGPMGLAVAAFARLRGAGWLTMVDGNERRLEKAVSVARVNQTVNFKIQNAKDVLTGGPYDVVIDAVGSTDILLEGSGFLRPGGKVCSLGVLRANDRMLNVGALRHNTSLHMLNFPYGEYDIMPETADMMLNGEINPKDFYSHVLPVTKINEAMALVRSQEAFKVVMAMD